MSAYIITGIESVSAKSNRVRVRIEGAEDICIYSRELRRLGWREGTLVSEEEYDSFIEKVMVPRAKSRALHLLEKMDRTRADLASKLKEGGYPDMAIEAAINHACEYNYIDDERYARNYIFYHKGNRSRRKLFGELLKKGVDSELACRLLDEEYDADEVDMIRAILEKRHYDPGQADNKMRSKTCRYLAGRGFDFDDISAAMTVE